MFLPLIKPIIVSYVSKNNLEYIVTLDYSEIFLVSPPCSYYQLHLTLWADADTYLVSTVYIHTYIHIHVHVVSNPG